MISLSEAKMIALNKKGIEYEISEIYDMGDSWLFGFCTKENKDWLFEQPLEVLKKNGIAKPFFPPHNMKKFKNKVKVDIE